MTTPALPHRWRLIIVLLFTALDIGALIASHFGVGDEILAELMPQVQTLLLGLLALLFPASIDAVMVEWRRLDPRVPALPDDQRLPAEPTAPVKDPLRPPPGPTLGFLLALFVGGGTAALSAGCSAGPQTPISTTPQSIQCRFNVTIGSLPTRDATADTATSTDATAGVVIADNDCNIDRSAASASPQTTGNDNRGARVNAQLPVNVGTGAP